MDCSRRSDSQRSKFSSFKKQNESIFLVWNRNKTITCFPISYFERTLWASDSCFFSFIVVEPANLQQFFSLWDWIESNQTFFNINMKPFDQMVCKNQMNTSILFEICHDFFFPQNWIQLIGITIQFLFKSSFLIILRNYNRFGFNSFGFWIWRQIETILVILTSIIGSQSHSKSWLECFFLSVII